MPAVESRPVDADLAALLAPEPPAREVVGRAAEPEPACR
jgi:hypothetical protein